VAVETRRRAGKQSLIARREIVRFDSLRDDWVKGADLMVRLVVRSAQKKLVLQGFPAHWVPLFVHFGASWTEASITADYVPLASELSAEELERISLAARNSGALREMVEAFASLDPLVADVLYRLDRRMVAPAPSYAGRVRLTGWQSYGRPEVLHLNEVIGDAAHSRHVTAVLLPCARKRPYQTSRTHKRIWSRLAERAIDRDNVDKLVVSSIGIVPESFWDHPVVLAYDSGVPDIYRVLRLMRAYFTRARFERVIDCLEFKPYSDCLQIVAREGLIGVVEVVRCGRGRSLPQP
jgi:predicted RNA-binding protein